MIPLAAASLAAGAAICAVAAVGRRRSVLARMPVALETPAAGGRPLARLGASYPLAALHVSGPTLDRLRASGLSIDEREIVAVKAVAAALVGLACLSFGVPILCVPCGWLAYRMPDIALSRRARARLSAADREVPVLLDLLAVATSAGLAPQLAFRRAVDAAEGPLADELRPVVDATDLGARWRDELRAVADRLNLPDLRRVVGALMRADALGSSLAEEVTRLAGDVRESRRVRATERARAAPVKMLFPLVFLVLPAFLLLTVVPVLISTVQSIQ
ncbi:MAG TPA: type II secretion system F family protein [Actinomycetota bacterium]